VGEHVLAGNLELLLEEYEQEPLPILAVYTHKRHLSARVRKFIDHLSDYFAGFSG
jgi:DNA-binding transcriptional LysR family regulator